jgi:hypothetical protein
LVLTYKIFLQELWLHIFNQEHTVPTELLEKWQQRYKQPDSVRHYENDHLVWLKGAVKIQVHGFADASEMTYRACVYLMSVNHQGEVKSFIVFIF